MKRLFSSLAISSLLFSVAPMMASAMDCYVDPVHQYSGAGRIKSAVFMRSEACVSGTMVLRTLSAGTQVSVVGFTDGWYEVTSGGKRGWIGQQFLESSAQATGVTWSTYTEYRSNTPAELEEAVPTTVPVASAEESYEGVIGSRNLIKLACPSIATSDHPCRAVYYVGADGKRHAFPNSRVFYTWYANFDDVRAVSAERLGQYMLGANVTYRPGARMVKFTTDNKTYAVDQGGVLRWVKTEELAVALYGTAWNTKIDDIPDTFYMNYTFGDDVASDSDFNPTSELAQAASFD
ncbi:SH3 domain-containing protein [Candidatus Uhrbacteria bacterium]|nr:SH3 domain-containing protein [Candidatus Uhrbacteria bacterium]